MMKQKYYVSLCHNSDDVSRRKVLSAESPTQACAIVLKDIIQHCGFESLFLPALTQFIFVSEQGFAEDGCTGTMALLPVVLSHLGYLDYDKHLEGKAQPGMIKWTEDAVLSEISRYSPEMIAMDEEHIAWLRCRISRLESECLIMQYLS